MELGEKGPKVSNKLDSEEKWDEHKPNGRGSL